MIFHICFVSSAILPFLCFCTDTLCSWNDGSVLSRFLLRKHCRVGMFIRDRLLVSLLLCSAFSSTHPDSISVEVTMHTCCAAQAVASKTFGKRGSFSLAIVRISHPAWTARYARSSLRSRTTARTQRSHKYSQEFSERTTYNKPLPSRSLLCRMWKGQCPV